MYVRANVRAYVYVRKRKDATATPSTTIRSDARCNVCRFMCIFHVRLLRVCVVGRWRDLFCKFSLYSLSLSLSLSSSWYSVCHIYTYMQSSIHPYVHTCIHTYMHTYVNAYVHAYIHKAYIHTCMHTYIHTYMMSRWPNG